MLWNSGAQKKDIQFAVIENTNAKSETLQRWALFAIIDFHNDVWKHLNSIYQAPIVNIYHNQKKGLQFNVSAICIFRNARLALFNFREALLWMACSSLLRIIHFCVWSYFLYFSVAFSFFPPVYRFYSPLFSMISVTQSPSPVLHVQWQHRQGCMPESRHHA